MQFPSRMVLRSLCPAVALRTPAPSVVWLLGEQSSRWAPQAAWSTRQAAQLAAHNTAQLSFSEKMVEAKCILFFHPFLQIQPEKKLTLLMKMLFLMSISVKKGKEPEKQHPALGTLAGPAASPSVECASPGCAGPLPSGHAFMGPR